MAIQNIDIADKITLDSVKTDTTALRGMGGIKYNATSSKSQVYDVENSEWVDLNVGGGGGASPTLVVINEDGTMTNKNVTVTSSDGLFTQTKLMPSANYIIYELPWLGNYNVSWTTAEGSTITKAAAVTSVGGITLSAATPRLTVVNTNRSTTGLTITLSCNGTTYTRTMPDADSTEFELNQTGTWTVTWIYPQGNSESTTKVISSPTGNSVSIEAPYLTIINQDNAVSGNVTIQKSGSAASTAITVDITGKSSETIRVYGLGTYNVTWQSNPVGTSTQSVSIASNPGTSYTITYSANYPSFSAATDLELATMLNLHYQDEIDLSTIWSVGDTRKISLSSFTSPNPDTSQTWAAQDIIITILDFDHTDLATPINGHTKAALTLQTREVLSGTTAGSVGTIYVNGDSSYDMSFTKWSDLYMRTYLNNQVFNAFPSEIKSVIKPSKHYRHTNYNDSASEIVTDNLFLPSYPEIFGTASYNYYVATNPVEGTQFKYYQTNANRIKYNNSNGNKGGTAQNWWEGSASSYYNSSYGYYWCRVYTSGSASANSGNLAFGLAPAFAM